MYLQAFLSGLNRGDVSRDTPADDDEVLLLCDRATKSALYSNGSGVPPPRKCGVDFSTNLLARHIPFSIGKLGRRLKEDYRDAIDAITSTLVNAHTIWCTHACAYTWRPVQRQPARAICVSKAMGAMVDGNNGGGNLRGLGSES